MAMNKNIKQDVFQIIAPGGHDHTQAVKRYIFSYQWKQEACTERILISLDLLDSLDHPVVGDPQ